MTNLTSSPSHSRKKQARELRFTDTNIRDRANTPGEYADDRWPFLRLFVSESRVKTWGLYKWSPAKGYAIRRSLGTWPRVNFEDARKEAQTLADRIDNGEDLTKSKVAATEPGAGTVKHYLDKYTLNLKRKNKRDYKWAESIFTRDNSKAPSFKDWLNKPLSSITRDMLSDRHAAMAEARGTAAATRAMKAFRALYNYAEKHEGYEGKNIAKMIESEESPPRQRVLTKEEKARFLAALDDPSLNDYVRPFFRLLLLTGVRWGNLCAAHWSEFDLKEKVWVIPSSKAKAGDALRIVLRPEAVKLLKAQRVKHPESPWVFPSPKQRANKGFRPLVEPTFAFKRVLAIAKIDTHTTPHDLRRTFGSTLIRAGESLPIVAAALGHKNPNTTAKHYAWMDDDAIRAALNRVPV